MKEFFFSQIRSWWVLSGYSSLLLLLCGAGRGTRSMSQQCHLRIIPRSWRAKEPLYTLASRRMFGAIQKIQRKRSYSSEPLLIEGGKKPNYDRKKMSRPSPGSSDNGRMTMWPYRWPPLLSSLAVYGSVSLKCVTWSTCKPQRTPSHPARCWSLNPLFEGEK